MGPSTGRRRCYDLPPTSYTGVPREWNATHCRPGTLPETSRPVVVGGDGGLVFSGIHDPVEGGLHRYEVRRHTFWRDFTPRVVLPFRKGLRHPVSRPSFPSEPRPVWSGYFLFVPEQALVWRPRPRTLKPIFVTLLSDFLPVPLSARNYLLLTMFFLVTPVSSVRGLAGWPPSTVVWREEMSSVFIWGVFIISTSYIIVVFVVLSRIHTDTHIFWDMDCSSPLCKRIPRVSCFVFNYCKIKYNVQSCLQLLYLRCLV